MRPVLKQGLRRLWRDATTLQLGVDPECAMVLAGLSPQTTAVLDQLDGTLSETDVVLRAPAEAEHLLSLLKGGGALDDAGHDRTVLAGLPAADRERLTPDLTSLSLLEPVPGGALVRLARRQAARVQVRGAGRVGAHVATLLAAAGVGNVIVDDDRRATPADVCPGGLRLDDVGRVRSAAASVALARVSRPRPPRWRRTAEPMRPELVVLAPTCLPLVDLDEPAALERQGVPHLLAGIRETTGVVGPLVVPGRSACLTCQHLHRADRDPAWPMLLAQVSGRDGGTTACDVALAAVVAGLAALQALALLDGTRDHGQDAGDLPAAVGGSLELKLPDWRTRRRSWPIHLACACAAAAADREAAVG